MGAMMLLMVAALAAIFGLVSLAYRSDEVRGLADANDMGQFRTAGIVGALITVVTLIVIVFLLSGVAEPFFNATENITQAVANASTGNSTIDALMGPFSILVAAVLVIAFIRQVTDRV